MSVPRNRRGGVVLCGGKSSRMGQDKAWLPFGTQTLLTRTVELVAGAVPPENIICVAAAGQPLPDLPAGVTITRDVRPELGPLAAVGWGLRAAAEHCDAALVVGCDYPLLAHQLVELLFDHLGEGTCVAGRVGDQLHPLPAVMRVALAEEVQAMLAVGDSSLRGLLHQQACRWLNHGALRDVDPELHSLVNCNNEADYRRALRLAGLRS